MMNPREVALHVDARVGERGLRLGPRGGEPRLELGRLVHHPHAPAAPAGAGLEQKRVADLRGLALRGVHVVDARVRPGHHRNAVRDCCRAAGNLVAHQLHGLGRRADEGETVLGAAPRKARVLRHEPVAGVNRVASGAERGGEQRIGQQVALRGGRRADAHRAVRLREMGRVAVGGGVHRHGFETGGPAGPKNSGGDLAAIGNEHALHGLTSRPAFDAPSSLQARRLLLRAPPEARASRPHGQSWISGPQPARRPCSLETRARRRGVSSVRDRASSGNARALRFGDGQLRIRAPVGSNGGSGRMTASRISPRISTWKPPVRSASSLAT